MKLQCCASSDRVSANQIARELEVTVQAVHQYLKLHGVMPMIDTGYNGCNMYRSIAVGEVYRYWRRRYR